MVKDTSRSDDLRTTIGILEKLDCADSSTNGSVSKAGTVFPRPKPHQRGNILNEKSAPTVYSESLTTVVSLLVANDVHATHYSK